MVRGNLEASQLTGQAKAERAAMLVCQAKVHANREAGEAGPDAGG